ncbi:hypothetical protein F7725_012701 [Dissostichus mawsoni]|uniref:Uncharacterized protein n=1 Tax=Dissostichus mawsoni TaxID=36200 RepID=A0A7J5YQC0_DISMA|nr:hypothetical protein F7725_012701 [Dissostichus mawsoni]
MNRFIKTTSAFLKRPAVPRNFNKDCCRVTSLRGGETLKLLPQGAIQTNRETTFALGNLLYSADSPSDHGSACCASVGSLYPQCCICTRLQGPGQAFYTRGQQTGRFCLTYLSRLFWKMGIRDGSRGPKPYHKALESLKSSWIDLSPTSDSQIVTLRWGDHCLEVNATVSGIATTFRSKLGALEIDLHAKNIISRSAVFKENLSDHKGHILQSCSDCLLWTDTFRNGDVTGRYILQFSIKERKIDPEDVDIFKKQVGCLSFPENFHSYDGKTELCPDNKEGTE